MMQYHRTTAFKQRGFSLLEALVAFLILSIGMLGIASLQLISLKAGSTATFRTVAVIKVEEILERIRINKTAVDSYAVTDTDMGVNHKCNDSSGAIVSCTSAQIVEQDIFVWKESLRNSLANGTSVVVGTPEDVDKTTASIVVVSAIPGTMPTAEVTVTISWQERNTETQTMDNMSYSVISQICVNTTC